jgi:hypothetical protein
MDTRPSFEVARRADHVEVTGLPADEVREALTLWSEYRETTRAAAEGVTNALLVMAWRPPLLSEERQRAAQRVAARRAALLATPVFTYRTLAEVRGQQESSARAWYLRNRNRVLKIDHEARTYLPAFQFDDVGELRPGIAQVNRILKAADTMSEWSRWSWWQASTSYLSGASPLDVVDEDLEAVETAARRQTAPLSA